ncbi:MAG TPA: PH domain-containing protein [Verrucomicrobiota bacterium]|nr:hypothetical protein [Verrucomicrobiales bacterium]HRI11479.1 PH domain-containing protein [Verrucomicrobiota bacterium]
MNLRTTFSAPWGRAVRWATALTIGLFPAVIIILGSVALETARISPGIFWATASFLLLLLIGAALFAVRGFRIKAGRLEILRPGWTLPISLDDLRTLEADPEAMKGVLATAGNSGFMGCIGWFWSRRFGAFRAWVTDSSRCVRLTFPTRVIVVSPDDPVAFVAAVKHQKGWNRSNATLHLHAG